MHELLQNVKDCVLSNELDRSLFLVTGNTFLIMLEKIFESVESIKTLQNTNHLESLTYLKSMNEEVASHIRDYNKQNGMFIFSAIGMRLNKITRYRVERCY